MKSILRTIFSASVGLALFVCVVTAWLTRGFAADVTVLSFSLLVVYGLVEMAILSYSATPAIRSLWPEAPRSKTRGKIDRMPVRVVQASPGPVAGRRTIRREIARSALVA